MKIEWIKSLVGRTYDGRGEIEYEYFWGTVRIAVVYYDWYWMKADPRQYRADILLPGVKWFTNPFSTIEQAQAAVETEFILWTQRVGLA